MTLFSPGTRGHEDEVQSPNRKYIPAADELRGLAAALVFVYHSVHSGSVAALNTETWLSSQNPIAAFVFEGHTGVALFMVLSGFILAHGTLATDISYWGFLKNRALRILPLMFVVLVFALYATRPADLGSAIAPFLLLANIPVSFSNASPLAGTVWTVSVEFQFYLIAPFLFLFVRRGGITGFLLPAMILFWLLRMSVLLPLSLKPDEMYRLTYFSIAGRINQFLFGIGLAYLTEQARDRLNISARGGTLLLIAGSVGALVFTWVLNQQGGGKVWHWWHLVYPEIEALIWVVFIAGYLSVKPLADTKFAAWMQSLGKISFSLYILHYAVVVEWWSMIYRHLLFGTINSFFGVVLTTAALSIPVLVFSALSYRCVEKPFLDLRSRYVPAPEREAFSDLHEADSNCAAPQLPQPVYSKRP